MKVVIQRVKNATCKVLGNITGKCDNGFLLLVGFGLDDKIEVLDKVVKKIAGLRVFEDEMGKMNKSLNDIGGSILSISQFTLYADIKHGNRPSFTSALNPKDAKELYLTFNQKLREYNIHVEEGIFGADMKLEFLNDGPVTILVDSDDLK